MDRNSLELTEKGFIQGNKFCDIFSHLNLKKYVKKVCTGTRHKHIKCYNNNNNLSPK